MDRTDTQDATQRDSWWRRQLPPSPLARSLSVQSILFAARRPDRHEADLGDQRAEYQGAAHIGGTLGSVWAPALFTYLAMEHDSLGWITIASIASSRPSSRAPPPAPPSAVSRATGRRADVRRAS